MEMFRSIPPMPITSQSSRTERAQLSGRGIFQQRTPNAEHNESVFFTCWQRWRPMGKKFKCTFLKNLSSDFRKILHERAPRTDLPNCITRDPPPKLGAEPGGHKFGSDPPKISHFRFPGVEIFTTVSSAVWSLHKLVV